MASKSSPTVFISCSRKDQGFVEKFMRALDARRVDYWADIDIRAGADWSDQIEKAWQEASIFLLFVSPEFLNSKWSMVEMGVALSRVRESGALLVPVLIRDAVMPDLVKRFSFLDARSLRPEDLADEVSKIIKRVGQVSDPGAPPDGL